MARRGSVGGLVSKKKMQVIKKKAEQAKWDSSLPVPAHSM
jgi:hypothetical protein